MVRPTRAQASVSSRHVEAFLEMLVAERGAAALTREAYGRDLAHAEAHLAKHGLALQKARIEDLRGYVAALGRSELNPRTLARRLSALRQFYRFLVVDGVRRDDPTAGLDTPRLGRPLPKTLAQEDVAQLIDAAGRNKSAEGTRLRCLLELLYATGLRISELVGLPFAAAKPDARVLLVRGKGGKERLVPLGTPARAALAAYRAKRGAFLGEGETSPWLFPSRGRAGHLTRERVAQLLKALAGGGGRGRPRPRAPLAPCAPARLREPPGRRRRGPQERAGDAGPRRHRDDPDLHACRDRAAQAAGRDAPSSCTPEEVSHIPVLTPEPSHLEMAPPSVGRDA
jgi:integrase/recombinase XerD